MNRDLKLDGIKFIMIFLVVLGHIKHNDYGLGINNMIFSFHMPVFIFLSGYFTSTTTNREKQIKWIRQTLLIYLVAQTAQFVLGIGIDGIRSYLTHESFTISEGKIWRFLVRPRLALWYLICLIYWRIAIWRIFNKASNMKLLLLSIVLALISGFVHIDEALSFQRAFAFFPFFVLGIIFRKQGLMSKLSKIPYSYAIVGIIIGLIIAKNCPVYLPRISYCDWHDMLMRLLHTGLGIVLCLLILRIARVDYVERFAKYGAYTLWIYIGHTFLIKIGDFVFPLLGITLNLFTAFLLTCCYCALFIWMAIAYHSRQSTRKHT